MPVPARLPLFPLPLVLFPGAALPLHIFEPRYRRMLADVRAGDGRFGIVAAIGGAPPAPGLVGCVAQVRDVEPLPDGRSNLVVDGGPRFAVARLVEDAGTPYLVAEVEPYEDAPGAADPDALRAGAERVRDLFARVARAARAIADEPPAEPALPDDPAAVAFAVAARIEFELAVRQQLLASRSPLDRLDEVGALLERAVGGVEDRAAAHRRARSNGRGPGHA